MLPGLAGIAGFSATAVGGGGGGSASGAGGNIAFKGSLPVVTVINGGAVTLTFSNFRDASNSAITLAQNDFIVVAWDFAASGDNDLTITSTGWTEDEFFKDGTSANHADCNLAIYTKRMGPSPDTSFVTSALGGSTRGSAATAFVFSGVDTTTALDVPIVTASGNANETPDPPSITPSSNGAAIVVIGASASINNGSAFTNPGDLSSSTNHFRSGTVAESRAPSIGMGFNKTWTGSFDPLAFTNPPASGVGSWVGACLALRSS